MREEEPGVQVEGLALEREHLQVWLGTGEEADSQGARAGTLGDVIGRSLEMVFFFDSFSFLRERGSKVISVSVRYLCVCGIKEAG